MKQLNTPLFVLLFFGIMFPFLSGIEGTLCNSINVSSESILLSSSTLSTTLVTFGIIKEGLWVQQARIIVLAQSLFCVSDVPTKSDWSYFSFTHEQNKYNVIQIPLLTASVEQSALDYTATIPCVGDTVLLVNDSVHDMSRIWHFVDYTKNKNRK